MRLTERIHLVGGGSWGGTGLSPNPDCHVYLVDGGGPLALVDAGSGVPGSVDAICRWIENAGFRADDVEAIFVTHMHGDHVGGAPALAHRTGAVIYASPETAEMLATADEELSSVRLARDAGIYPPDFSLSPTDASRPVLDQQAVTVGDISVTAVATPGHSAGHTSFWLGEHRALLAGDAVFWRGRVLVQAVPDCDPHAMARSITRLADLDVDALLPGHGGFTVTGGARHLAAAAEQVRSLRMPPGL